MAPSLPPGAGADPGGSAPTATLNTPPLSNVTPAHATQADPAPAANGGTSAADRPSLTSPAAQLGPALAALHATQDGAHHVTVRLDPAELGQVQVRITRAQDGAASVSVSAERPETLRSLQADLSHLHQALDRAGFPEHRSVTLHLASPELGVGTGGSGQTGSHASPQHQPPRPHMPNVPSSDLKGDVPFVADHPQPARWLRAGVNITA